MTRTHGNAAATTFVIIKTNLKHEQGSVHLIMSGMKIILLAMSMRMKLANKSALALLVSVMNLNMKMTLYFLHIFNLIL
jgi:hypothetical protein